jgi:hypothetical protein
MQSSLYFPSRLLQLWVIIKFIIPKQLNTMKQLLFLALGVVLLSACKKDRHDGPNGIFNGPEVQVHDGKSWTWVQLNDQGNPERIGITLTDKALNSVPVGENGSGHGHGGTENNYILKFHPKGSVLPFNHVGVGWNPVGHEPENIYGKPHFDFHFYMPTPQEIAAIPPYEVDSSKFKNWPAADYFPATYINPGGGVPQMGAHWLDVTSPELSNGAPFTQTFIYGSYDGKVTFYEPMITLDFLKASSNYSRPIPQPAKVQKTGWYPTTMKIVKKNGVTDVILDAFVYRTQS